MMGDARFLSILKDVHHHVAMGLFSSAFFCCEAFLGFSGVCFDQSNSLELSASPREKKSSSYHLNQMKVRISRQFARCEIVTEILEIVQDFTIKFSKKFNRSKPSIHMSGNRVSVYQQVGIYSCRGQRPSRIAFDFPRTNAK